MEEQAELREAKAFCFHYRGNRGKWEVADSETRKLKFLSLHCNNSLTLAYDQELFVVSFPVRMGLTLPSLQDR